MEPDQDFPKFLKRVRKEENVYYIIPKSSIFNNYSRQV